MTKFQLGNTGFKVGRKQDGTIVDLISHNFVNDTYHVIGQGGTSPLEIVNGNELELLEELLVYTEGNGRQFSLFKGSVIQSDEMVRIVRDVNEFGVITYDITFVEDLFINEGLLTYTAELKFFDTVVTNGEFVAIYNSLEDLKRIVEQEFDSFAQYFEDDFADDEETDELHFLFEDRDVELAVGEEGYVYLCKAKDSDMVDIINVVFVGADILDNDYERATVSFEDLLDMLATGVYQLVTAEELHAYAMNVMLENDESAIVFDDLGNEIGCDSCIHFEDCDVVGEVCEDYEEDNTCLCDMCLELEEKEKEEEELDLNLYFDNSECECPECQDAREQFEFEYKIMELTGEPFDLDVLLAKSKEEVYMEELTDLEFQMYQLEMLETYLKAFRLMNETDENAVYTTQKLEDEITKLKDIVALIESLSDLS